MGFRWIWDNRTSWGRVLDMGIKTIVVGGLGRLYEMVIV